MNFAIFLSFLKNNKLFRVSVLLKCKEITDYRIFFFFFWEGEGVHFLFFLGLVLKSGLGSPITYY